MQAVSSRTVPWKFSLFFCGKKGYAEGNGFPALYLHLLCLLSCVWGKKKGGVLGVYKGGCETGEAIKSLAFTLAVLPTKKNVARLGAAEVPADRETSVVSLRFFCFFFFQSQREVLLS